MRILHVCRVETFSTTTTPLKLELCSMLVPCVACACAVLCPGAGPGLGPGGGPAFLPISRVFIGVCVLPLTHPLLY